MNEVDALWVYLSAAPLTWLTATLVAYLIGLALFRAAGERAAANPVLIAVAILALLITVTDTSYAAYFEGAQFVHFMLGPATVALAVPLWFNLPALRRMAAPMLAALAAGSLTAIASAIWVASALGASTEALWSIAPKSATSPIAMGVAEGLGGAPALTAVLVLLTGVIGAVAGPATLSLMRVRDPAARGFALGVASHGIGAARAFQEGERAGAFAGVAMGLNGLATAILAPLIAAWLLR